jgi:hypothetical protein
LNCGYHGPNHSAYNQALPQSPSNVLFPSGKQPSSQVHPQSGTAAHCSGQSHSFSVQPHHLLILTDHHIMAAKTKGKKGDQPSKPCFPREILNMTGILHLTDMKLSATKHLAIK